jgi:hypothetical protein
MGQPLAFIVALVIANSVMGVMIGFFLQVAAKQFDWGPTPRMFVGGLFIILLTIMLVAEFRIVPLTPLLLLVFYVTVFQVGTRFGRYLGIVAPDEDEPPDDIFDPFGRYE